MNLTTISRVTSQTPYLNQPSIPYSQLLRETVQIENLTRDSARQVLTRFPRVSPTIPRRTDLLYGVKNMDRIIALSFALALSVSTASAQEGILSRTGRALDNAGRGIRNAVDNGIAEGQMGAEERDVLNRVTRRLEWDKHLIGSPILISVQPGRIVTLRGSVASLVHKQRAADLVSSTIGVDSVVDELAIVKVVKVIETRPSVQVIQTKPAVTVIETPASVVTETKVIEKP
jgi:hyperosmotically inducible periplasmic protein